MMNRRYDPGKHNRRSIRRRGWDYRWPGAYFVTICTHERAYLFENGAFRGVAENAWLAIPGHEHAQHVRLDEWVVMPNHVHGIFVIDRELDVGARQTGRNVESENESGIRSASPSTGVARGDDGGGATEHRARQVSRGDGDGGGRNRARQVGTEVTWGGEGGGGRNRARQVGRKVIRGDEGGSRPASPLRDRKREQPRGVERGSIGAIVGNYKSLVARRINNLRRTRGGKVWQRGYYDRIVRNKRELNAIRRYIRDNPRRWAEDRENLERLTARMRRVM